MDRKELMAQQLKKTSKMSFPQLRRHIASHMKKSGADKETEHIKQFRINRTINHPT